MSVVSTDLLMEHPAGGCGTGVVGGEDGFPFRAARGVCWASRPTGRRPASPAQRRLRAPASRCCAASSRRSPTRMRSRHPRVRVRSEGRPGRQAPSSNDRVDQGRRAGRGRSGLDPWPAPFRTLVRSSRLARPVTCPGADDLAGRSSGPRARDRNRAAHDWVATAGVAAASIYLRGMTLISTPPRRRCGCGAGSRSRRANVELEAGRVLRDGVADELATRALPSVVDRALPHSQPRGALAVVVVAGRQRQGSAFELGQGGDTVQDASQSFAAQRLGDGILVGAAGRLERVLQRMAVRRPDRLEVQRPLGTAPPAGWRRGRDRNRLPGGATRRPPVAVGYRDAAMRPAGSSSRHSASARR